MDSGTTQLLRAALKAERHPFNPRSSLLVSGTNTGALSVWEVPDAGEPRKLGHFNSSDGTALVGAGIISVGWLLSNLTRSVASLCMTHHMLTFHMTHSSSSSLNHPQSSCLLVCFLKNLLGNLTCKAWRINTTPAGGTLLIPLDATPSDVWAAVDGATPPLHADGMTEAAFWTSLRSTEHASSFAQFQGNARHGYDVARIVIHPQGYLMAQMLPLKVRVATCLGGVFGWCVLVVCLGVLLCVHRLNIQTTRIMCALTRSCCRCAPRWRRRSTPARWKQCSA